jgi:hypothetical protein
VGGGSVRRRRRLLPGHRYPGHSPRLRLPLGQRHRCLTEHPGAASDFDPTSGPAWASKQGYGRRGRNARVGSVQVLASLLWGSSHPAACIRPDRALGRDSAACEQRLRPAQASRSPSLFPPEVVRFRFSGTRLLFGFRMKTIVLRDLGGARKGWNAQRQRTH